MTYSCHSFRHLYPTAGKQLDANSNDIESRGRWQPCGGMSERYDSKACVAELLQKTKVVSAVSSGWALVDPGCVPSKPPPTPTLPPHHRPRPAAPRGPEPQDMKCYVMNVAKGKLHGYSDGLYTMCRQWRCGERDSPSMDALFVPVDEAGLLHFVACRPCSIHKCIFPKSEIQASSGKPVASSRSASSSSRSFSSSSSSAC